MYDVVFVDDQGSLAAEYAGYVAEEMQLSTTWTTDPSEAVRIVQDVGVKILVVDQSMPNTMTTGSELAARVRRHDPFMQLILLSGEASGTEITRWFNSELGRYIEKNLALSELPVTIYSLLVNRERMILSDRRLGSAQVVAERKARWFRWRTVARLRLLTILDVDDEFVDERDWRSVRQVNAGEEIVETVGFTWSRSEMMEINDNEMRSVTANFGTSRLAEIAGSLKSEISKQRRWNIDLNLTASLKQQRTFSLPKENPDPRVLKVLARTHAFAPIYTRVVALLRSECVYCARADLIRVTLYYATRRFATRQTDYLSDLTQRITPTGTLDVE